jgi:glycosyltransferase involved in cell wall biosynthesis
MSPPIRVLVWQWGRRGAGPRVAIEMAAGLDRVPGCTVALSLSTRAEILADTTASTTSLAVSLPVGTYRNMAGYAVRLASAGLRRRWLRQRVRALSPDVAICAMPGPLDFEMASVLRALDIPYLVVVHDADRHPGDGSAVQMLLQRALIRGSAGIVALSGHVANRLREQGLTRDRALLMASLPPFVFGPRPPPPLSHGGPLRLLCFGRLLPYKGLDLLADALAAGVPDNLVVRVVGQGPPSRDLDRLTAMPRVSVENRWVPEGEIGALIGWADALVLPYREASQSGVAAAAIAARRWVVSTRVGGLVEQFRDERLAILCVPHPDDLRRAIEALIAAPPADAASADPRLAWAEVAEALMDGVSRVPGVRPTP